MPETTRPQTNDGSDLREHDENGLGIRPRQELRRKRSVPPGRCRRRAIKEMTTQMVAMMRLFLISLEERAHKAGHLGRPEVAKTPCKAADDAMAPEP